MSKAEVILPQKHMDEFFNSPPSSPSSMLITSPSPPSITGSRLCHILQAQPDSWSYAILWQISKDQEGRTCFNWADDHLNGIKLAGAGANGDVTSIEWFYVMSLPQSFSVGEGAMGKAYNSGSLWLTGGNQLRFYNCHRVKEAYAHGMLTMVYVPTSIGVLEFGSDGIVNEDWGLVKMAEALFGSMMQKKFLEKKSVCNSESDSGEEER